MYYYFPFTIKKILRWRTYVRVYTRWTGFFFCFKRILGGRVHSVIVRFREHREEWERRKKNEIYAKQTAEHTTKQRETIVESTAANTWVTRTWLFYDWMAVARGVLTPSLTPGYNDAYFQLLLFGFFFEHVLTYMYPSRTPTCIVDFLLFRRTGYVERTGTFVCVIDNAIYGKFQTRFSVRDKNSFITRRSIINSTRFTIHFFFCARVRTILQHRICTIIIMRVHIFSNTTI